MGTIVVSTIVASTHLLLASMEVQSTMGFKPGTVIWEIGFVFEIHFPTFSFGGKSNGPTPYIKVR